jgi:hypothetical protein
MKPKKLSRLAAVESALADLQRVVDNLSEELSTQRINLKIEQAANIDLAQKFEALITALHKLAL